MDAVDDRERVGIGRAQRDARRRMLRAGPDDPRRRLLQLRVGPRRGEGLGAEDRRVVVGERRLVGGRANVARRARAGSRGRGSPPRPAARAACPARA